jgi:DNA-binding LacI/PurR family transcriptional regulator
MPRVATLRDVAQNASTSVATAGRALGGYGKVSSSTRKRVLDAARKLNYHPNAIARGMKQRSSSTIGIIIGDICSSFFATVVRAIEAVVMPRGYKVIVCNSDENIDKELMHARGLFEHRVDGLIVATTIGEDGRPCRAVKELYGIQVPTVFVDRAVEGAKIPSVYCDHAAASYEATTHLIQQGFRRIGAVLGRRTLDTMMKRIEGYRKALIDHRIKFDPALVLEGHDLGVDGGYNATKELLGLKPRPTALLVMNNLLTLGALNAIRGADLQIPRDIAIVGWDDFYAAPFLSPPLTAIEQPARSMGTIAAEQLLKSLLHEPTDPSLHVVLKTNLIIRESSLALT